MAPCAGKMITMKYSELDDNVKTGTKKNRKESECRKSTVILQAFK